MFAIFIDDRLIRNFLIYHDTDFINKSDALSFAQRRSHMKSFKTLLSKKNLVLQSLCSLAIVSATMASNSRCAYIFHDPKKPDSLKQLRKF